MQTNHVEITGNLAAKPEARKLPSGTPVANARLGQSYSYQTKDGMRRHTNWFTLAFYGELVKTAVRLTEGDEVNVVGTIQQREFTPKDGSTRKVYEIVVKEYRQIQRSPSSKTIEPTKRQEPAALSQTPGEAYDAWAIL